MEELKTFAELATPDTRQQFFSVREPGQPLRPLDARDIYDLAVQAELHLGVPEAIRSHFAMAQNLLAYSWFCYPFNVAAELHGYVSVEYALKTRFPDIAGKPLHKLFDHAVAEGAITSEGFSYGRAPDRSPYPPDADVQPPFPSARSYVRDLAASIRELRNSLAHGTNMLHMKGGGALLVCSELINQLFPRPSGV